MGCVGITKSKDINQIEPNSKTQILRDTSTGLDSNLKFQHQNPNLKQQKEIQKLQNNKRNSQYCLAIIAQQNSKSASNNPQLQGESKMKQIQDAKRQKQQQNNNRMVRSEVYDKPKIQNSKKIKSQISQLPIKLNNYAERGNENQVIEQPIQDTKTQNIQASNNNQNEVQNNERIQLQRSREYRQHVSDIVEQIPIRPVYTFKEYNQLNQNSQARRNIQIDVNNVGSNIPQPSNPCANVLNLIRNIFN